MFIILALYNMLLLLLIVLLMCLVCELLKEEDIKTIQILLMSVFAALAHLPFDLKVFCKLRFKPNSKLIYKKEDVVWLQMR